MKHPHYDKIVKWASDPERFKVEVPDSVRGGWVEVERPSWKSEVRYRIIERHPEMWHINGKEFPAPLQEEPEEGQSIYEPDPGEPESPLQGVWDSASSHDERRLKNRILHDNREAAVAHAYAMLNAQPVKQGEDHILPPRVGDIGFLDDSQEGVIEYLETDSFCEVLEEVYSGRSYPYSGDTYGGRCRLFLRESDGVIFGPDLKPVKGNQWRDEQ